MTPTQPQAFGPKERIKAALSKRHHAERLGTMLILVVINMGIALNVSIHMLGVSTVVAVFFRDLYLILFYAEETIL